MLRDLELLMQLQEIDLRIHGQELAKEQLPITVKELEQVIANAQKSNDAAQKKLAEAEGELKIFDDQIRQAQEGLEKSQERLNSIKTNREYDAVHAEIETQKGMVANSENRKKKLTEEIARLRSVEETARQEQEKIKTESEPTITELRGRIEAIDTIIASIVKEREAVIPAVGKSSLRTYEQIKKRRKTAKVISMVDQARTCTICYKVLEPHIISEVKRSAKINLCQSCGSILIWSAEKAKDAPSA
jgi:predicted  nucleic acid-binding Zn-ribbon protein